ncbi:Calcium-independent phospholipase A2-gamma, partial [Lachnellula suecica]
MEQNVAVRTGKTPGHLDQSGLCLLSLDGGGVRGLSSLLILKNLMTRLNDQRKIDQLPAVDPYEVFDLIGGTSTGGLIAIMLGRLEMSVEECISAYIELMGTVFESKLAMSKVKIALTGKVAPRFDSANLEMAIKKILHDRNIPDTELFNDGKTRGCRVFVCTTAKETKDIERLRSYEPSGGSDIYPTICEAALATSAATGFFKPVIIDARMFVDGALGANNPATEVEAEASDLFCPTTGDIKPLVKCLLSIGTGQPSVLPIDDGVIKFAYKTLAEIATETERTAENFARSWRGFRLEPRYSRFNVDHGLQDIGLAECEARGPIQSATAKYLARQEIKTRMEAWVESLRYKQNAIRETGWQSKIYQNTARSFLQLPSGSHNTVPFPRNSRFVGRRSQLDSLEKLLFVPGRGQKAAIMGLGGMGKTQVAIEFAFRVKENHPECSIFWVPAMSIETVQQAYLQIGRVLHIPGIDEKGADIKKLVQDYLSQESSGEWLLIVDNADDIDMWTSSKTTKLASPTMYDYLPASSKGSILFTTRNRKDARNFTMQAHTVVGVESMDENDAKQLLGNSLGDQKQKVSQNLGMARKLLLELTFLPLVIVQAAAYISANEASLSDYFSLLKGTEKEAIEILSEEFTEQGRYGNSVNPVASTWLLSFKRIQNRDPLAAKILSIMSCFEPKAIPRFLIIPKGPPKKKDLDAIGTLKAYSFITEQEGPQLYDLHRLVHLATRNWLEGNGSLVESNENALKLIYDAFPKGENLLAMDSRIILLPHANAILESKSIDRKFIGKVMLLRKYGECLLYDGRHKEAEIKLSEAAQNFQNNKEIVGLKTTEPLECMFLLAQSIIALGQLERAEEMMLLVLENAKKVLGKGHPGVLDYTIGLALVYRRQGKLKEAEQLSIQIIEAQKKILKADHSDLMSSMSTLAMIFASQERWKEAEDMHTHVLDVLKKTLGPTHFRTLASMANLAAAFRGQDRNKEAENLDVFVLKIRKGLDPESGNTLRSMHNLAADLFDQGPKAGRKEEALELGTECIRLSKKILGDDHPQTKAAEFQMRYMLRNIAVFE